MARQKSKAKSRSKTKAKNTQPNWVNLPRVSAVPPPYTGDKPTIYGKRTTTTNKIVYDNLATFGISQLHSNKPEPIFISNTINEYDETEDGFTEDDLNRLNIDLNRDRYGVFSFYVENEKLSINPAIVDAVNEGNNPLLFVIVTKTPHAILCLLCDSKLYTFGFGYSGGTNKYNRQLLHNISENDGAIYTADYLYSKITQSSSIIWVDIVNKEMLNRIQSTLNKSIDVNYTCELKDVDITSQTPFNKKSRVLLTGKNTIALDSYEYCALFNLHTKNKTTNCINWAMYIIGQQLNCGFLYNSPATCNIINQDDFDNIKQNINNDDKLRNVIQSIQKRLLYGGVLTRIAQTPKGLLRDTGMISNFSSRTKSKLRRSPVRKSPVKKSKTKSKKKNRPRKSTVRKSRVKKSKSMSRTKKSPVRKSRVKKSKSRRSSVRRSIRK